jgi:hypothetical protein
MHWNRKSCSSLQRPMTDEAHARYFADREQEERALGDRSRHWRVAAIHTELAERYEALAKVFGAKSEEDPATPA